MFCTGSRKAKFAIQTPSNLLTIDVAYDDAFFQQVLKDVKKNYYSVFIPDYFEMRTVRNLQPITLENFESVQ